MWTVYFYRKTRLGKIIIYKYTILLRGSYFFVETPQICRICFIIPNKYKTQKGEKLQTPEIFNKYSSALLELVSLVGHSANSVGVRASGNYSTISWMLP